MHVNSLCPCHSRAPSSFDCLADCSMLASLMPTLATGCPALLQAASVIKLHARDAASELGTAALVLSHPRSSSGASATEHPAATLVAARVLNVRISSCCSCWSGYNPSPRLLTHHNLQARAHLMNFAEQQMQSRPAATSSAVPHCKTPAQACMCRLSFAGLYECGLIMKYMHSALITLFGTHCS